VKQVDLDHPPAGTYFNTGAAARRGLRLNRFCYDLRHPTNREAYRADREALMDKYGLTEEERRLVRAGDWLGLVRYGANLFVILRLADLHGDGLTAVGAQMRGQSVEEYLATRQVAQAPGKES
jgi:protocatechuate 4,5-dioxygenase alpha subunit